MTLAWLPKTIDLGSVLLYVSLNYEEELYKAGEQVIILSTISAILTVPISPLAMTIMEPYLCTKDSRDLHQDRDT